MSHCAVCVSANGESFGQLKLRFVVLTENNTGFSNRLNQLGTGVFNQVFDYALAFLPVGRGDFDFDQLVVRQGVFQFQHEVVGYTVGAN